MGKAVMICDGSSHAEPEKKRHGKARLRSDRMMALENENILLGPGVEVLARIGDAVDALGGI